MHPPDPDPPRATAPPAIQDAVRNAVRDAAQGAVGDPLLLARVFDAADTSIVVTDPHLTDNPIVYHNPAFERVSGYASGEIVGRNCRFLQGEGSDPAAVAALRGAVNEGRSCRVTLLNYRRDGTPFWNDIAVSPVRDAAGRLTHFVGVQNDVTRRVEAEAERERLLAEQERLLARQERLVAELGAANARQRQGLSESEERFRLLVEGMQDYAIFLLDPEGRIATWNAGAERFKGYEPEEIIGEHFSRFYTPEDIARRHPWNELEVAAREGRYEEEGWRVKKDGSRFWASVVITALRGEDGGLRGFGKVTRDITERRQRERERAAAETLEQQRHFLKDVLLSVTEGKLRLCDGTSELPAPLSPEPVGDPIPLSRRALKAVRERVAEVAASCGMPKDSLQDLVTAASECAMNAVQHAGGGAARVYQDEGACRVQVWVEDSGRGIDLSNIPRATLEPGFSTGGVGIGHGFSLMIACCQRIHLLTGPSGTTVVLSLDRTPPQPAWLR